MAIILGKYPLKTTIKSTIMAVLVNFVLVSYFIYLNLPVETDEVSSNAVNQDGITEAEKQKKEERKKNEGIGTKHSRRYRKTTRAGI